MHPQPLMRQLPLADTSPQVSSIEKLALPVDQIRVYPPQLKN